MSMLEFSEGELARLTDEELREFEGCIGRIVLRLPLIARIARHKRPLDTFRDYVRLADEDQPVERAAKEFLHDLLGATRMTTKEIVAKWYPDGTLD